MKDMKTSLAVLAFAAILCITLLLSVCSCGPSFPYQGSYNGVWDGHLTVLTRSVPIGGSITMAVDSKGVTTGSVSTTGGTVSPATIKGQVDENGNLSGTVTFTINGTAFNSNWQGKISKAGSTLGLVGTWSSDHGSGTFSGNSK
jgi:hypothetical protein